MIRICTFLLTIFLFATQAHSQAQWMWAEDYGGKDNTSGGGFLGKDNAGNYYLSGDFSGTRSFGSYTLIAGGSSDAFVAKLDSTGSVIWAISGGGSNINTYLDVRDAFTTPAGTTYVTGKFNGTITFGSNNLTSTSPFDDMFIVGIAADGSISYVERFGSSGSGAGTTEGKGVWADDSGNIYVTGVFSSSITFDTITLISGHQFNTDVFILKISGGSVVWANRGGSSTQSENSNGIEVDASGNVYIGGSFKQTADFGSVSLTSSGVKDLFLAKYNSTGSLVWVVKAGGTNVNNNAAEINALKLDASNNIFVTGTLNGNNVNFGNGILLSENQSGGAFYGDFFLAKYNSSGVAQWAKNGGGSSVTDAGNALDVDAGGNVYVTGSFQGVNASFNGLNITATGNNDVFVAKYSATGSILWINKFGSSNTDNGADLIVDATNKAYISGIFTGNITVGTSTLSASAGTWKVFLARIDAGSTSISELNDLLFSVYPNPAQDVMFLEGKNLKSVEISDLSGKLIYSLPIDSYKTRIDLKDFPKGNYFLKVSDNKSQGLKKLIIN